MRPPRESNVSMRIGLNPGIVDCEKYRSGDAPSGGKEWLYRSACFVKLIASSEDDECLRGILDGWIQGWLLEEILYTRYASEASALDYFFPLKRELLRTPCNAGTENGADTNSTVIRTLSQPLC
ncbi:hypothetical protein KM043_008304 [Ampulex compressa]|nr:hypothetical protein KM043_008304 [Ampulex compressa]